MTEPSRSERPGFTLTELMITIALIAVLLAFLLPTLAGVTGSGRMAKGASQMRWIGTAMTLYSGDSRDFILPSRFNHQAARFPGHARSQESLKQEDEDWYLRGTWADILWTENALGAFAGVADELGHDYRYDSPDERLYELTDDFDNPLRSPAANTIDTARGDLATPYGIGALERADPGYFAANNFFDNDRLSGTRNRTGPFTNAQIRLPDRSLYLVDSFAGEIINWGHFCDVEEHT